jgi:hypothetical protein
MCAMPGAMTLVQAPVQACTYTSAGPLVVGSTPGRLLAVADTVQLLMRLVLQYQAAMLQMMVALPQTSAGE